MRLLLYIKSSFAKTFHKMKFFSGLKSLKRSIGNQILDANDLYNAKEQSPLAVRDILAKVKQRNKKYLENRKKKRVASLEISATQLPLNDSEFDTNAMFSPSTKDTQTPNEPKSPMLHQIQTLTTKESLTRSINNREQHINTDFCLLPSVKGPIKPRIALPRLRNASVSNLNKSNQIESPHKNQSSLLRSAKSTAHTSLILSFDKPSAKTIEPLPISGSNRILPKSLSVPRLPLLEGPKGSRSLLLGKRIVNFVIDSCQGLTTGLQQNSIVPQSEQILNRNFLLDIYNTNIEMLRVSISKVDAAMKNIRAKYQVLDLIISEFVSAGLKSHNTQLHLAALRLQGKIQMKFSEFAKAITVYKLIRRLADFHFDAKASNLLNETNSYYLQQKLFAYKRLARCYQELQNYRLSIFYYTKMLQTAWLLKSVDDELFIYDGLGVQHYYLGDLQKSEYYHDRAMKGLAEPLESKIRHIGVQKLLSKLQDGPTEVVKKKKLRVKTIEDNEVEEEYPDSEDEFEMPENHQELDDLKIELQKLKLKKTSSRIEKRSVNQFLLLHEREKKATATKKNLPRYYSQLLEDQQTDSNKRWKALRSELIAKLEADVNPPKPSVLINHLSTVRSNHVLGTGFLDAPSARDGATLKKINSNILPKQVAENIQDRMNEIKRALIFAREQVEMMATSLQKSNEHFVNHSHENH